METPDIEAWVLTVVEAVKRSQQCEDARVELKQDWPLLPEKVARQLAGHANALRGKRILWIIGLSETEGIVGASREELADWLARVKSRFVGEARGNFCRIIRALVLAVRGAVIVGIHI